MSQERYRTRETIEQQRRPLPRPGERSPESGQNGGASAGGLPPRTPGRRGLMFGALAAVAAVAVGATALISRHESSTAAGGFEFTIVADPQQVADYLHHQNLPPATAQKLEQQVKQQELVVWHVTQRPGWNQQQGQVYSMDNGTDHYQFSIRPEGQEFGVFAEKSATGFTFSADANPGAAKMTGTWSTPAGRTSSDMQPGQTRPIRLR